MEKIAIIFAGGVGSRMGAKIPKQFLEYQKKPIIIHTIEAFENHPEITKIYIACNKTNTLCWFGIGNTKSMHIAAGIIVSTAINVLDI